MRIALVHDWLTGMRGGEKCLEVLCRRFPQAPLYTLFHLPGNLSPTIEQMDIHTSFLQRVPCLRACYRYLLPFMPSAIRSLRLPRHTDLVVSLSHAVAKGIQVPAGVAHVCYCFTPMRYAWHLREAYFPQPRRLAPFAMARDLLLTAIRRWDYCSAGGVTHFVAISRTVAQRIEQVYGRSSRVIYPPVDTDFYRPEQRPREDYYLCVSALVPYKRVDLAIAACRKLGRRLVVIGDGPERRALARQAGPQVELLGWRDDVTIRAHYCSARALLFPGEEDFGIVPVEAMACGLPVLAYQAGGATETILAGSYDQPGSGLFFSPQTTEALADAIVGFETNPQWIDPGVARRQAERFAVPRFENEFFHFLEEVADARGRVQHEVL